MNAWRRNGSKEWKVGKNIYFYKIQDVSLYMEPMWLLITQQTIILFFFVSDIKIEYYNNY